MVDDARRRRPGVADAPDRWWTGATRLHSVVVDACWRPMVGDEAGDFHDVVDLRDGRVAVVVGDAPGYGPVAAAIAEDLRSELRRSFRGTDDVVEVFARADAMLRAAGDELIATAVCVVVDAAAGLVHVASAGHPPPVVCDGIGVTLFQGAPDPPLGVSARRHVVSHGLPPDTALFLYTDGLIERRGTPLDESLRALVALCRGVTLGEPGVCEFARRATDTFGPPTDDATVVSVRLVPEPAGARAPAPDQAPRGRTALRVYLDPSDLRSAALQDVVTDLARRLEAGIDVQVEVHDVTAASSDTEEAGVLAAPTIVRLGPGPPVRVIGWFRSADELARALQLPFPEEAP